MNLEGPISDRLRDKFDKKDEAWNPPRDTSDPEPKPLPKNVSGWSVGARGGDKKK